MRYKKHGISLWEETNKNGSIANRITKNLTFENYEEAIDAAKALSLSTQIEKVDVIHLDSEKLVEEWSCGVVRYCEDGKFEEEEQ